MDGTVDVTVAPTAVLSGEGSADIVPPAITINSPTARDYLRSEQLPIEIAASDTGSGVAFLRTKLDGRLIENATSSDLFFESLGSHHVSAEAYDRAGNLGTTEVDFRVIATPESTIANIERALALGWITKKSVAKDLIKNLKAAIKIEKKIEILEEKPPGKPKVIKKIERLEKKLDKVLGKQLLKELETHYKRARITLEGYELLKEGVDWMLQNQ